MSLRLNLWDDTFTAAFESLLATKRENAPDVHETVTAVLKDVRARGDTAVKDYTRRFDRFDPDSIPLRVPASAIKGAKNDCPPDTLAALETAAARIWSFHEKQYPQDLSYEDDAGVQLGWRWQPIEAVGLYVPGGTAAYPSSVLMNAIPARVAGVGRLVMMAPTPDGVISPLVLAAAHMVGIDEIWCIGGAQAIAALAYGTESIHAVDKIVGPGNAWVAAAKRQVFGTVGIDMIAGPSEILVVADADNDPAWIAADLLSQAEHDPSSQSVLITDDAPFADAVEAAIRQHLSTLERATIAQASWDNHGAVIVTETLEQVVTLINRMAPEHLELAVAKEVYDVLLPDIRNAGAIFLGRYTPEAIGDYLGGPNHVLPTARSARFSSGLGVGDFMKRTTLLCCDADAVRHIGGSASTLARAEGLGAHALSVDLRLLS